eukprot:783-Heterococcus_DN1.PRE.2
MRNVFIQTACYYLTACSHAVISEQQHQQPPPLFASAVDCFCGSARMQSQLFDNYRSVSTTPHAKAATASLQRTKCADSMCYTIADYVTPEVGFQNTAGTTS